MTTQTFTRPQQQREITVKTNKSHTVQKYRLFSFCSNCACFYYSENFHNCFSTISPDFV